jgi:ABC-type microcin C transport system permease subunit YejB
MVGYVFRRLILIVPTILFGTVLVFSLAWFILGGVIDRIVWETAGYGTAQGGETVDEATTLHRLRLGITQTWGHLNAKEFHKPKTEQQVNMAHSLFRLADRA